MCTKQIPNLKEMWRSLSQCTNSWVKETSGSEIFGKKRQIDLDCHHWNYELCLGKWFSLVLKAKNFEFVIA